MVVLFAVTTSVFAADGAITMTLKKGMKNVQVKYLQQTLNEKGFTVATSGAGSVGKESTSFGPATVAAVKAFQVKNNLVADGVFGAKGRAALAGTASNPGTPNTPVVTGPVSVALATDNPASGSVVSPSSGNVFAKYVFTGNGTVTSLKLMRTGISANTVLPNIYLYDGATRLTDAATLNSDNTATFNATAGLFSVMGTKTISVVADVAGSDYSVGVNLVSVTSGGVITPMSVVGNVQYVAVATLGTVDFGTVTPTAGSIDPGSDIVVFNSNVNVGTRDVQFSRLAMRQIGSVNTGDIVNFRLMIDGATVATVAGMDSNGYVTFVLPTPKTITTGTRVFKVLADVVGGSSRTFQYSIRTKTDVSFLDTQYNAGIGATFASGSFPVSPVAASNINSGTVTVQKTADSPSGNTVINGHDVVLARYSLTTYGESLKIEQLKAGFTYNNVGGGNGGGATLRNGRIMVNGSQVGSTATLLAAGTTFTTNYTLAVGAPATLEIRADIYDNDGTGAIVATDTVIGTLVSLTGNTQKLSSLGYITVPSSNISGNTLTAQSAASLSMAKTANYANQTTSTPQTSSYKLASYTVSGSSVEDVNLDTVSADFGVVTGTTFVAARLSDVTLKIDGVVIGSPKGTVTATGNTFSITKTLVKNGSMTVEIWGTINTAVAITNADSIRATVTVSGVGAASSVASTTGAVVGQTIVSNTGSITYTIDASRPDASINDDAGTKAMANYKFAAVTDTYKVTDLTFTVADVTTVSTMRLFDGATEVASKAATATTTFSGLNWTIPAGQTKVLSVKLDLGTVGVGAGSTGASTLVTLTAGIATNGAGVAAAVSGGSVAGTAQYTYKALPTLSLVTLPTSALTAGTDVLAKFAINTNGTGTIGWNRIVFTIAKTSAPTIASVVLRNADSNSVIAGTATLVDAANAATCLATLLGCRVAFVPTTEQQVSGSTNYSLEATVGGTLVTSDYITTTLATPSAFAASAAYATVAATGGGFGTYAQSGTTPSFIWSDVSASSHDTTTLDWSNDFLVKSLPLNSQTLTK